jgi:heavy metal sensor kinase
MRLRPVVQSIRARITLWHLGVLVLILLIYMLFSQMFLWRQLTIELKTRLQDDVEVAESFLKRSSDGRLVWSGHLVDRLQERWIEVRRPDNSRLYRDVTQEDVFVSLPPAGGRAHQKTFRALILPDGRQLLVMREIHHVEGERIEILVARSLDRVFEEMSHLFLAQLLLFPVALVLAWGGGIFIAGRVLAPLQKIIARMQVISADRLRERLPVENAADELGQLSLAFNDLLAKLDRSFEQMRLFTADASHELRTPLATIRSVGEMALRAPRGETGCREAIASMLEEAERMSSLVNDLLALARSESGIARPVLATENLGEVVREEVALLMVLAEEKEQQLSVAVEQPCPVRLDRKIFRQALGNVLHNAIKYTPAGKEIRLLVGQTGSGCFVDVADSGPGIAPEHQGRIFDRFYRVDKVRSRETGGAGLGLAIAKWAVEIHGGRIELHSEPGQGSTFRLWLPAAGAERS